MTGGRSAPVVVIGDAIVDVIVAADGSPARFPGGAALNVAVGLSVLGRGVVQVASLGNDRNGSWVQRYLTDHGVRLVRATSCDFTGCATSSRSDDGEPSYSFNPALRRRHLRLPPTGPALLAAAPAVVVSAFPFDDPASVAGLCSALGSASGLRALDPNPRLGLVRDVGAFVEGFRAALAHTDLLKISEEDVALLYGGSEAAALLDVRDRSPAAVLLTRGAAGATYLRADGGAAIDLPVATAPGAVVDTLGAGDAVLAAFVDAVLEPGLAASDDDLVWALRRAMAVAAATVRSPGGRLRQPQDLLPRDAQ